MEIEIYSRPARMQGELIHNTTRRERNPVSRTSDANFSMRAADCGCKLIPDYHCLSLMHFDHSRFLFEDALKHISYQSYYGLEICSALYLIDNSQESSNVTELVNDLHIPLAIDYILPYLYSHDKKSYDVYKLFQESLKTVDLTKINPNTYFYYKILPISGLSEITYDCSPKRILIKVKSNIICNHSYSVIEPSTVSKKVSSQITIIEKLRKA